MRACGANHRHFSIDTARGAGQREGDVLELDRLPALADLLRDVFDLDDRVRFDDSEQVLLQQRVVERR